MTRIVSFTILWFSCACSRKLYNLNRPYKLYIFGFKGGGEMEHWHTERQTDVSEVAIFTVSVFFERGGHINVICRRWQWFTHHFFQNICYLAFYNVNNNHVLWNFDFWILIKTNQIFINRLTKERIYSYVCT